MLGREEREGDGGMEERLGMGKVTWALMMAMAGETRQAGAHTQHTLVQGRQRKPSGPLTSHHLPQYPSWSINCVVMVAILVLFLLHAWHCYKVTHSLPHTNTGSFFPC
jgi:hypothetical protein